MTTFLKQKYWHELFEAGVAFKALNSVWEMLGGILLLTRLHSWLTYVLVVVSRMQAIGERHDFLFRLLSLQIEHLNVTNTRLFVGTYLLFHGVMNAFLAYNLYRNRLWSYPVSIAFTSTFFVYQIYRLFHTHSPLLFAITLLDVCFIILTWHEWQYQKRRKNTSA